MDHDVAQLIEQCCAGDQTAWARLVDSLAGYVFAIARRHGLREDQCEDVAQTVFSTLARRIHQIRQSAALQGWLATTTKRECWRVLKTAHRAAQAAKSSDREPSMESGSDEPLLRLEAAQSVRIALERIGHKCRVLIEELFLRASTPDYSAIAARLSIPIGSIGPTRNRCLAKLAELLRQGDVRGDEAISS